MTNASFCEARTRPPAGSAVREKSRFCRYSASFAWGPPASLAVLGDRPLLFFAPEVFFAIVLGLEILFQREPSLLRQQLLPEISVFSYPIRHVVDPEIIDRKPVLHLRPRDGCRHRCSGVWPYRVH